MAALAAHNLVLGQAPVTTATTTSVCVVSLRALPVVTIQLVKTMIVVMNIKLHCVQDSCAKAFLGTMEAIRWTTSCKTLSTL